MTAIRPRLSPEAERLAQARAQKKSQILVSQSRSTLVLAVFYIALLIVPWALTCHISTQPSFIIQVYRWKTRHYIQYGWVIAINVLNSLAVVLSLPILSALLARAAVVFSQRRRPGQTLSVRQLFALADRDWYNLSKVLSPVRSSPLLRLGCLLLFVSILLPLIRSGLVAYDNVLVSSHWPEGYWSVDDLLGFNPSPVALKGTSPGARNLVIAATRGSLRITTGGIEAHLWPVCNDPNSGSTCGFKYGPYNIEQSRLSNFWESPDRFYIDRSYETNGSALMHASTLRAGSTIGTYRKNYLGAYTLGLKSGTQCETVSVEEVEEQCIRSADSGALSTAARGWNTSLEIPYQIRLNICYPPLERDPWEAADASPWKPINFTEHLYVGLYDFSSTWDFSSKWDSGDIGTSSGLHIHCQADSLMSYFEMGKASTNGVPTRLLEEMPAGFEIPREVGTSSTSSEDSSDAQFLGPLNTAAMAMFGNESWFDMLKEVMADVEDSNLTSSAAITLLCSMRPFGNIDVFNDNVACENTVYGGGRYYIYDRDSELFADFVRGMFGQFKTQKLARATLNTATFYANYALLSELRSVLGFSSREWKYGTQESDERMYVPVLSVAAIATVSILIALQVVGIVILLVYIYSSLVWTKTLDALAVARIGAQLSALDVFLVPRETGTLGPARQTGRAALEQLEQVDGLVGSTALTGHHDIEMATVPPPYAPRGEEPSTREEQRMPQPGAAAAAGEVAASDRPVPSSSPSTDEHMTRAPDGESQAVGGRGDSNNMVIAHAASPESQGAVLPPVTSIEALAVGGRGLIPRRRWKKADKPLPPRPADQ